MPFCHVTLKALKPLSPVYPKHLNTFGNYLRKIRLDLRLYQKDVAGMSGLDEMTICNWEKSSGFPKRYRVVKRLCEALGIDYREMLDRYHPLWQQVSSAFGIQLVKARIRLGMTQEQMARKLGIDPTTLRRWEQRESRPIKMHANFFNPEAYTGSAPALLKIPLLD